MSKFLSTIKKQEGDIISPFLRRLEKPHQDGIERNLLFLTCFFFVTVQKSGCLCFYEIIQIVLTLQSPTHVLGRVNHVSCIGSRFLTTEPPGKPFKASFTLQQPSNLSLWSADSFRAWPCKVVGICAASRDLGVSLRFMVLHACELLWWTQTFFIFS